jgi:flagellar basal body-associated protein FliL
LLTIIMAVVLPLCLLVALGAGYFLMGKSKKAAAAKRVQTMDAPLNIDTSAVVAPSAEAAGGKITI